MKNLLKVWMVLAGLMVSVTAFSQKPAVVGDSDPGWHRIAGLNASFKKQNESVHIMGNDEFRALKLKIKQASIHIERMQVFYESGDMEEVDVKKEMKAGESSGAIQLKHAGRDISKIAFTYHSIANDKSEKAEIEIYGLKAGSDAYDKKKDNLEDEADEAGDEINDKAKRTKGDIERAAEKTGDEIDEAASKTAAEIDDKRHETKVGPDGQVIYISDDNRFYYINEQGKKVFVTKAQLKDKDN